MPDALTLPLTPPSAEDRPKPLRIAIGLIEHMGDIVACEPVARYLRLNHPDAELSWAVLPAYRELIAANPFIDTPLEITCLTDWMRLAAHGAFDRVVDLHVNYRICQHCRIPLVKSTGNPFVTAHDWFDYGSLLEAFSVGAGLPKLSATPYVHTAPEHLLAVDALDLPERFCVLHRTSNDPRKDWSAENWQSLAHLLRAEFGLAIIEVGAGPAPKPLEGVTDLVNRLPILQTAEVIARATLFIGVDSGPAHLANAAQVPGVVLLGQYEGFRAYTPFTGFYATPGPLVKLVRNLNGPVLGLETATVADAVRYVLRAAARLPRPARVVPPRPSPLPPPSTEAGRALLASGRFDTGLYSLDHPTLPSHPADHAAAAGLPCYPPEPARRTPPVLDRPPLGPAPPPTATAGALGLPLLMAFYLPQFHPIAENDRAHGPGFSEWHNVVTAQPLFRGHRQPRLPGELGFYDLRTPDLLRTQIALARAHGIDGFCFYYYNFEGKRLLHRPLDDFVASDIEAPFLCLWANENWTRRWDGGDREIIIAQNHSPVDDALVFADLARLFADWRYVRFAGKPVLMIYKAHLFPNIRASTETWRREAERLGLPGLYLVMVDDWQPDPPHPRDLGFDAAYAIPSNIVPAETLADPAQLADLDPGFTGRIVDYAKFARFHAGRAAPNYKRLRTVMLPWDNTARYGKRAMVHQDHGGADYRHWLLAAMLDTMTEFPPTERMVFLHSWNEWCEGTYLEPDRDRGRFFLHETAEAVAQLAAAVAENAPGLAALVAAQRVKDAGQVLTLRGLRREADDAWRETAHLRGVLHTREEAAARLRAELETASAARHEAERLLAATRASTSWRLTAPLRAFSARLRRQ